MRRLLLAALLALCLSPAAMAQGRQNFSLQNRTGYQINELYVGPSSSPNWGRDILGENVLANGQRFDVRFPQRAAACMWDIKVVYEDGDESEFMQVNLCRVSTVTLFWNRQAGTTRFVVE